ncbi:phosphotransferase [Jiangella alkaliphila]|uniref:Phosphotransferase enzyme family protein n=1 Tax=Jiangella alkaliphila TaxID=419479 RepID=A0A1H2L8I5_9ACTN|nr:phosphotransferase [Jiangella alkaliphila]SDU77144.1 Phosphotransferase enzyme family protein [Jiangella alkaliphila]
MNGVPEAMLLAGAAAVRRVERTVAADIPVTSSRYLHAQRALWRTDTGQLDTDRLADVLARARPGDAEGEVELELLSAVVRLGKFSRGQTIKVRSYLALDDQPVSLKVWRGFDERTSPGRRERLVRAQIAGIDGYRSPRVLADGRIDDIDYLAETVIYGRHPSGPAERLNAAADVGTALCDGYRATMTGLRRLSATTHPAFRDRIDAALGPEPNRDWTPETLARLRDRVLRLIDQDRRLPVAVTHGDLVATNIIRSPDGRHHLVDWEHGRTGPVAFDLVKLILTSGDPARLLDALSATTRGFAGRRRCYSWEEQLALGIAQFLSWSEAGRRSAAAVGRLHRYEAEHRARLRLLVMLLP